MTSLLLPPHHQPIGDLRVVRNVCVVERARLVLRCTSRDFLNVFVRYESLKHVKCKIRIHNP